MSYPLYSAVDVADALVRFALANNRPLTNLQVQKLTYIVYGYWLGFTNYQLFQDSVEAWQYGPVIPSLYRKLAYYGANMIQSPILEKNPIPKDSDVHRLIETVYNKYGSLPAWQLVYLTHKEGTPWHKTESAFPNGRGIISPDDIRDYYQREMLTSN